MSKGGAGKKRLRESAGFSLVETAGALALMGVLFIPVTGFFLLQQRYLIHAAEALIREQQIFTFFEKLEGELAAVQYPWGDPSPGYEINSEFIRVTWSQGGQNRSLVLQENLKGWALTVDDMKRGSLTAAGLDFSPLLRGDLFCGIQASWKGRVFSFYTGRQPFSMADLESPMLPEVR